MAGPVVVDVRRIEAWSGRRVVGPPRRVALTGGQVSPVVERITVPLDDGELDLVAKRATSGEATALGLLPINPVFPQLVDSGIDEYGPGAVTTYHPGEPIGWTHEPPPVVYEALARLHLQYVGVHDSRLPRVDPSFLRQSFDGFARNGLLSVPANPVRERALRLLDRCLNDELLLIGLEKLPTTSVHGDVQGDNVIDGVLVDWGSARIGPAMLDVTLAAGQAGLAAYGEVVAGTVLGDTLQLGTAWARVVNNAMFVGAVAQRDLQVAADTVTEAESALADVGELLEMS